MSKLYESMEATEDIKIFLNGNENNFAPFKELSKKLLNQCKVDINKYPKDDYLKLRESYGEIIGLKAENIIAGNGSDEMLNLVISHYIDEGDNLITLNPDFSMYNFYCTINGGRVLSLDLEEKTDIDGFINFIEKNNSKIIIFSNPNNPTGKAFSNKDIIKLLKAFPKKIILIDEAYIEFGDESIVECVNEFSNLLVTRTLSKAWAMASLRVGFLVGNKKLIRELLNYKVPFNISGYSNYMAINILKNKELMIESVEKIKKERKFLLESLKKIEEGEKIKFFESKGNFIFAKGDKANYVGMELKKSGILIRMFKDNSIRLSIGNEEENKILIEELKSILKEE